MILYALCFVNMFFYGFDRRVVLVHPSGESIARNLGKNDLKWDLQSDQLSMCGAKQYI